MEATRTLLPIKIVHQKQYHIPGRVAEISATIGLERCKGDDSSHISSPPAWPVQKAGGSWRMAVGSHRLNQVVALVAAAVPDVISCCNRSTCLLANGMLVKAVFFLCLAGPAVFLSVPPWGSTSFPTYVRTWSHSSFQGILIKAETTLLEEKRTKKRLGRLWKEG